MISAILAVATVLPVAVESAFDVRKVEGFTVYVSKDAIQQRRAGVKLALEHLSNQLYQITLTVPKESVKELRRVPIWLANGEKKLGIAFHPNRKWLTDRKYAPPKEKSLIGIVSPRHYLHESLRQPWLAFHELTHGYDWFTLGKTKTYGSDAGVYKRAMKSGKYKSALHWNGRYRKPYHATNKMEFFAETSEAFFGTNDIYPFVRAELRDNDPETFRVLAGLWHVDLKQMRADEQALAKVLKRGFRSGDWPIRNTLPMVDSNDVVGWNDFEVEGWRVKVRGSLLKQKGRFNPLVRHLKRDLHYIKRYVPAKAAKELQKTTIWVSDNNPKVPYVAWHNSLKWLGKQRLNAGKLNGIEIGSPENYRRWFAQQPSVLLHVLAYNYFEQLSDKQKKQVDYLYKRAREVKAHQSVLRFDGTRVKHPGLRDAREFFAEMSTTLFGTNDQFPFVRIELKDVDPQTYAALMRLWLQ